ncbi:InlB B-repeat-containing protein [Candidatus Saccharibacteria bacterium]|nr:InlB B-repeat-containing protein [Candidatus Saccharibacteria bacterium]
MLRSIFKNKHIARLVFAMALFLPVALITGIGIINSSGANAWDTWMLIYHTNNGTNHFGSNVPEPQFCTPEVGANEEKSCEFVVSDTIMLREGFDFWGWATTREAVEPEYYPGDTLVAHSYQTDLYAVWSNQLSFDLNGGYGDIKPQFCQPASAVYGVAEEDLSESDYLCNVTIQSDTPTRDGYFFLGWGEASTSTEAVTHPGEKYTISVSTTVYAIWAPVYSVIFNLNDKTGGTEVLTCHSDTTTYGECNITIPEKVPTRDGYDFLGWATINDTTTVAFNPGDILTFGGAGRGEVVRGPKTRKATETKAVETKAATTTHIDGQSLMLYAVWKEATPIPVPDTGIMTTDGDQAGKINNVAIYVAVPTALLICGWMVKRATSKKVNFTKKR